MLAFILLLVGIANVAASEYNPVMDLIAGQIKVEADEIHIKKNEEKILFRGNVKFTGYKFEVTSDDNVLLNYHEELEKVYFENLQAKRVLLTTTDGRKIKGKRGIYNFKDSLLIITGEVLFLSKNDNIKIYTDRAIYNTITGEINLLTLDTKKPSNKTTIVIKDIKQLKRVTNATK
jgi:lipopolysaccharide export system protein LptA